MKNSDFVTDVYRSIRFGVPAENRQTVKMEFDRILKVNNDLPEAEFRDAFLKEAKPFIETYARLDARRELKYIRMILFTFLIMIVLGALIAILSNID